MCMIILRNEREILTLLCEGGKIFSVYLNGVFDTTPTCFWLIPMYTLLYSPILMTTKFSTLTVKIVGMVHVKQK